MSAMKVFDTLSIMYGVLSALLTLLLWYLNFWVWSLLPLGGILVSVISYMMRAEDTKDKTVSKWIVDKWRNKDNVQ